MNEIFITIAGLEIVLEHDHSLHDVVLQEAYTSFISEPFEHPDITVRVDATSAFPSTGLYRQLLTSQPDGLWTIYEDHKKKHYLIALQNIERDKKPFVIVSADRTFRNFVIHDRPDRDNRIIPLRYPVEELVVIGHININRLGILLHSAGIALDGRGYLFSGTSGSGKSTIAEIWQQDGATTVLTDERVIIRDMENDLWAFGTPWHGTAGIHRNMGVPIDKIFFIEHGKENRAHLISRKDALNRLIVRCFPAFWNRDGMEFVLELCERIVTETKCYELQFVPDSSIIDFIKKPGI